MIELKPSARTDIYELEIEIDGTLRGHVYQMPKGTKVCILDIEHFYTDRRLSLCRKRDVAYLEELIVAAIARANGDKSAATRSQKIY